MWLARLEMTVSLVSLAIAAFALWKSISQLNGEYARDTTQ
jgi:hypothetical protein